MDPFEEAQLELGLEPSELEGTFPAAFVNTIRQRLGLGTMRLRLGDGEQDDT